MQGLVVEDERVEPPMRLGDMPGGWINWSLRRVFPPPTSSVTSTVPSNRQRGPAPFDDVEAGVGEGLAVAGGYIDGLAAGDHDAPLPEWMNNDEK